MIIDPKVLKQRYSKRIAGVRDNKVYIGPETVSLRVGNACNLTCQYCWTHAPGNPAHFDEPHFFPLEKFREVVRDCVDLEVDQIFITASGEPTLHPSFKGMMECLQGQPIKVKVFTNAAFPESRCQDVIKADHVVIDLSAINREQYKALQGKDLFDRVVSNIKQLVSLRDTVKPGFIIEIVYILNTLNVDQKKEMQRLAANLGVKTVFFKKMNLHPYNQNIALTQNAAAHEDVEGQRTPAKCLNGWFHLEGTEDFTSMCCRINGMRLETLGKYSLKDIWSSKRFMYTRLLGKQGYIQKMFKACDTCPYYEPNIKREKALVRLAHHE